MKRLVIAFALCLQLPAQARVYSKTTFTPRPSFYPASIEMVAMDRDRLVFCADERQSFSAIGLGGASTNSCELGRYFSPFNNNVFTAGEFGSKSVKRGTADVIANYFGVLTSSLYDLGTPAATKLNQYTFESELSFNPKQDFFGFCFLYHRHFSKTVDTGFWGEIILPIKWVRNNMNLCEKIITPGGPNGNDPEVPAGFFGTMTQAFAQNNWEFGKICGAQQAGGVADLQLKLGYTYVNQESCHLSGYVGAIVPTSNKNNGEFVFAPIYGNGNHAALYTGVSAGFRVWRCRESAIYWEADTAGVLMFTNSQVRSMDIKDKSWSRYMWVYTDSKATTTTPGINVFTQRVQVFPGSSRDLNIAFVFERPCWRAEVGYHFYARQAEEIKSACSFDGSVALASIINNDGDFIAGGVSRDRATINDYTGVLNDTDPETGAATYRVIKQTDLDLDSAAHPAMVDHAFYLACSYLGGGCRLPWYVGLGAAYDFGTFGRDNTDMPNWMLFARAGVSY